MWKAYCFRMINGNDYRSWCRATAKANLDRVAVVNDFSMRCYSWRERVVLASSSDLPPAGPAVITRVYRFDIRAAPPAQARRA